MRLPGHDRVSRLGPSRYPRAAATAPRRAIRRDQAAMSPACRLSSPIWPGKRLEILREIIPGLSRLAVLANGHSPIAILNVGEVQAAAPKLGIEVNTLDVKRANDLAPAIDQLKGRT